MHAKIVLMSALLGGASVLSIVACSSDDATDGGTTADNDASAGGDGSTAAGDGATPAPKCDDSTCGKVCKAAAAPKCKDQAASIIKTCEQVMQVAAGAPQCKDAIDAAMNCLSKATFTCDGDDTTSDACGAEQRAAFECVTAGQQADAGASDAGAGDAS